MNIENNKTIAIIKQMVADGKITQEDAEKYCPELAESEDEKIRNELKCMINNFYGSNLRFKHSITKERMLTWIEKQGGQKKTPIEGEFPYDNPSDTLDGEIENIWGKLNSGGRFSATKEGFREVITHFVNYIKEQDDWEIVEQKPAWSEEDELQMQGIIDLLPGLTIRHNWLKSLKDRVQPQSKREWSEEDGDIRDNIIRDLKRLSGDMISPNQTYQKEIQWLKSLRPQNTWKPSEEQMDALYTYIYNPQYFNLPDPRMELVESVYKDLKKLK